MHAQKTERKGYKTLVELRSTQTLSCVRAKFDYKAKDGIFPDENLNQGRDISAALAPTIVIILLQTAESAKTVFGIRFPYPRLVA